MTKPQKGKEWEDWELDLSALLAKYREPKFEQERLVKVLYFVHQLLHQRDNEIREKIREMKIKGPSYSYCEFCGISPNECFRIANNKVLDDLLTYLSKGEV